MNLGHPSRDIAQRYVERLERQGIGDLDDADHETCMLARWDGLLEWLDEHFVSEETRAALKASCETPPNVVSINDKANKELQERFRGFIDALDGLTPAEMLRKAADLWELGHGDLAQAVAFTALEEMKKGGVR